MLAVTTFSLGTMVTAFGAATSNATPRAARTLIDDPISQNVLSTFIGAFVFAIVGLIAASVDLYGEDGRAVLLAATGIVIGIVIVTLFGWVDYLANLSRLGAVVEKLEERAAALLAERARTPFLGALPPTGAPPDATPIALAQTGYVARIDLERLEATAEQAQGAVHVALGPGGLADPLRPVAYADWPADAATRARLADCFSIANERSLDQDPRHALIVLGEVASRALSPGVNDPGTAIGVIARQQRLLTDWARTPAEGGPPAYPHLHLPGLDVEELVEDAFGPLARDGAPMVEVGLRLQKTLLRLATLGDADLAAAAAAQSRRALDQAEAALVLPADHARLAAVAREVATAAEACAPAETAPS
jgi:uncharacterized membrane protein